MAALIQLTATQVARRRLANVQLPSADREAALRQMRRADSVAGAWALLASWLRRFGNARG